MMKRGLFLKTLLLLAILPGLASCAGKSANQAVSSQPILVAYNEWWGDYTLLVAKDKGYFQKYGLDVEPVYYPIFSDTFTDLAAGQIDAGMAPVGDILSIDHSTHMKIVGISDDGGADSIIARPEIKSISDLKGKKVGIMIGSQYEMMVTLMLQSAQMNVNDITLTGVTPEDAVGALSRNEVQAVYTWEPYLTEALVKGNHVIFPKEGNMRLFPDTIVFNARLVKERPADVRAFLKAWFEAVDYRLNNPEEVRRIAAKYLNKDIQEINEDPNLGILTLQDNKAGFNPKGDSSIFSTLNVTSDYLISIGGLAQKVNPLELLDPTYLP